MSITTNNNVTPLLYLDSDDISPDQHPIDCQHQRLQLLLFCKDDELVFVNCNHLDCSTIV